MSVFGLIIVITIYLAIIAYLGYKGYKNTKSLSDYMVGGRNVHPYIMAMSYGATFISTAAIVGFGGIASLFGMSLMWLVFCNIFIGIFVAFIFLGKRTRRLGLNMDAHTFPEFLGRRYDSKFIQWFSGLIIFIFMPIYTAAVLIGASRIMEGMLNIPFIYSVAIFSILVAAYVIMGGLKGVMYTDALQGTLMFFGMLVLLIYIYVNLGGVINAHKSLAEISNLVPQNLINDGHRGWTSSPATGSKLWWIIFSSLVFGVGIGVLSQPQLVVRFMTVKSNKELNRAVIIGAVFIFVTVGTPYIVGSLSNVYFYKNFGKIAIQMAGGNADKVIPLFISSAMPVWFSYIFMLVILSAAMSTLSSLFHSIGTSAGRDIFETLALKGKSKGLSVVAAKVSIVISILLTVYLALTLGSGVIARATAIFFGITASSFLAPYIGGLYWKKLTKEGAITGIVSGITVSLFMFLFTHEAEAKTFGLCKLLTGKDTLINGVFNFVDPVVIALPISIILTIAVSLCTKVKNETQLTEYFEGVIK
ncbi:MAG: sodium:solute symporter [Spirochaetes bacterium GWF1_31_7]|nr:MAG: sodium:solute symporter [Spirochaetes bacterium GWE1_32_154]OHD47186.1 MAG: sodium:solute symporter [Spirochaetes bacterium GWE2_31_10]OHD48919.1 MAG: sodium:solute symporter [Spirochaetes bacterium GWF1_31_7]OHD76560.1 MAG: sodium:solute symporter [Spirochaetes bacterium RIFOXYB1_FULL_32_8]HBD92631.1 sodium:solute symporter [Spirochaetia bacterium]